MEERVTVEISGGVAHVALNRPDKLNALDLAMFEALVAVGRRLSDEKGVRAVVLSGTARSFSVGIDLGALAGIGGLELTSRTHGQCNLFQQAVMQCRELPIPVIAAIHGHALGGGCQLAMGADVRIVTPDAQLSVREVVWGLVPDMAGTALMRRFLRDDVIRDITFSGRILSGKEAFAIGLATRLADDALLAAFALAREIAGHSPDAIRSAKRLLNSAASGVDDAAMLLAEAQEQQRLLGSRNHGEALAAYHDRRTPAYEDQSGPLAG